MFFQKSICQFSVSSDPGHILSCHRYKKVDMLNCKVNFNIGKEMLNSEGMQNNSLETLHEH